MTPLEKKYVEKLKELTYQYSKQPNAIGKEWRERVERLELEIALLENKIEKQGLKIEFWKCPKCKYRMTDIEYMSVNYDYGCPKCKTSFGMFKSIEEQEEKKLQPAEIEKYFDEKNKRITDDMGWTGEYHLSAKDILDLIIDWYPQSIEEKKLSDAFQAGRNFQIGATCEYHGGEENEKPDFKEWIDKYIKTKKHFSNKYYTQEFNTNCFPIAVCNAAKFLKKSHDYEKIILSAKCEHGGVINEDRVVCLSGLNLIKTDNIDNVFIHGGIITIMHPIFNLHSCFAEPVQKDNIKIINSWLGSNEIIICIDELKRFLPNENNRIMYYLTNEKQ